MYHAHFTYICMDIMLNFDPRAPSCSASYTIITSISLKYDVLYLGQIVPSSECDAKRSYSPSKTTILNAFFQVYLQQEGRKSCFRYDNQTRNMVEAQLEVAFTRQFLRHLNTNGAIFVSIGHQTSSVYIHH